MGATKTELNAEAYMVSSQTMLQAMLPAEANRVTSQTLLHAEASKQGSKPCSMLRSTQRSSEPGFKPSCMLRLTWWPPKPLYQPNSLLRLSWHPSRSCCKLRLTSHLFVNIPLENLLDIIFFSVAILEHLKFLSAFRSFQRILLEDVEHITYTYTPK